MSPRSWRPLVAAPWRPRGRDAAPAGAEGEPWGRRRQRPRTEDRPRSPGLRARSGPRRTVPLPAWPRRPVPRQSRVDSGLGRGRQPRYIRGVPSRAARPRCLQAGPRAVRPAAISREPGVPLRRPGAQSLRQASRRRIASQPRAVDRRPADGRPCRHSLQRAEPAPRAGGHRARPRPRPADASGCVQDSTMPNPPVRARAVRAVVRTWRRGLTRY